LVDFVAGFAAVFFVVPHGPLDLQAMSILLFEKYNSTYHIPAHVSISAVIVSPDSDFSFCFWLRYNISIISKLFNM
jgi:hypothetical protein